MASVPVSTMVEALITISPADYVLILSVFVAIFGWFYFHSTLAGIRGLPPGPFSLPVIGHLHLFTSLPHRFLYKQSQKYGPILFIRLGSVPTVVVSCPALAKQFLHHHDESFAHRPRMEISDRVFYGHRSMFSMEYNAHWRDLRKLYTQEILSVKSIQQYRQIRDEEILLTLQDVEKKSGSSVQLRRLVFELSANILARVLMSKRSDGRFSVILDLVTEGSKIFVAPIIGDLIPYLKWFDPSGWRKRMDSLFQRWDALLERVLSERLLETDGTANKRADMLTKLLDFNRTMPDTRIVKASLLELLGAGTETTSSTIEWVVAELLRNPETMRKLQEELGEVVGAGRQVEETDFPKLSYLQAVMKEAWRLHPPAPLLLPHLAKEETEVGGYKLPKNTRLLVNVWAIGRDPNVWEEAEEFRPERFMGGGEAEGKDVKGRHYELLPFGTGRRACPGMHLAIAISTLAVANLVHSFDWRLAPEYSSSGIALMDETVGVTTSLAPPLLLIPTTRRPLVPA